MKWYCFVLIILITCTSNSMDNDLLLKDFVLVPKPFSVVTCAQVSSRVYEDTITALQLKNAHLKDCAVYMPTQNIKDTKGLGFRGVAFINHKTKQGIVAYRGTEPKEMGNLLQDIGIFFAEVQKENPYEILHRQLNSFLWGYNKKWYAAHKFGDYTALLGKYILSWKPGILGTIIQKVMSKIVNHKVFFLALAKIIGFTVKTQTQGYIREAIDDAQTFYDNVQARFPGYYFYATGHSLGGFLAQLVGAKNNVQTYTFNAPGAQNVFKKIYPAVKFDPNLIVNFARKNDIFGTFDTHIGITKKLPNFLDGFSMQMSAHTLWNEYAEKQYELTIKKYWKEKQSWLPPLFGKTKEPYNPYLHKTKDGQFYFDTHEYLYQTTSVQDYILENHSIVNLVNDLVLQEKYHFNS